MKIVDQTVSCVRGKKTEGKGWFESVRLGRYWYTYVYQDELLGVRIGGKSAALLSRENALKWAKYWLK